MVISGLVSRSRPRGERKMAVGGKFKLMLLRKESQNSCSSLNDPLQVEKQVAGINLSSKFTTES